VIYLPEPSPASLEVKPKQLICNFKAPTIEQWQKWQEFKADVKAQGLDICRVTLGFADTWLAARKGESQAAGIQGLDKVIHIHQKNIFQYQVQKPRRGPYSLDCVKPEFRRTFSSLLFEAYMLEKASQMKMEFSFRDFLELEHDAFRRIVMRLRRKGRVVANPLRTNPRFYFLVEDFERAGK
jgi:hypothetical protein